jgi:hypothetical protein
MTEAAAFLSVIGSADRAEPQSQSHRWPHESTTSARDRPRSDRARSRNADLAGKTALS